LNFEMSLRKSSKWRNSTSNTLSHNWSEMLIVMAFLQSFYSRQFWKNVCLNLLNTLWIILYLLCRNLIMWYVINSLSICQVALEYRFFPTESARFTSPHCSFQTAFFSSFISMVYCAAIIMQNSGFPLYSLSPRRSLLLQC
jgi:hypothetical protein